MFCSRETDSLANEILKELSELLMMILVAPIANKR